MAKETTWRPPIPDKAGRGAACSRIQQITHAIRDIKSGRKYGTKQDLAELLARLDKERKAFHKLYDYNAPATDRNV